MERHRGILGENLRALRKMHHLSQDELAQIAGVTRETVNKWESGIIGNIRNNNINNIREHFGLSVDDLRSESMGLAAQLRALETGADALPTGPATCCLWKNGLPSDTLVEVPPTLMREHPRCFAFPVTDDMMSRVLPSGCTAIIDPATTEIDATGQGGGTAPLYLIRRPDGSLAIRRVAFGSTSAFVSTTSYVSDAPDEMLPLADLEVLGSVIWYQATVS